ncbi:helix-turn-helix transcriptional regulator [Bacillus mojavensis]
MGAVSIDTQRKEREYRHLTLSDEAVVKYLIMFRSEVDILYGASTNVNVDQAGDVFEFNQELISLYASLDGVLEKCNLTNKQKEILGYFYDGYTISDMSKQFGINGHSAYRVLNRAIKKIVDINNHDWKECLKNQKYID